jgi:hypothetical protein
VRGVKKGSDIDHIIMACNSATLPLMHFSDIFLLPVHVSIAEIAGHSMPSLLQWFYFVTNFLAIQWNCSSRRKKKKTCRKVWVFLFGKKIDTWMKSKKIKYKIYLKFKILKIKHTNSLNLVKGWWCCPWMSPITLLIFSKVVRVLDTNVCWGITWRPEAENIH